MPKIGLAYISDREDLYLPRCQKSVSSHIEYDFYAETVIDDREHKLGLAGAANAAWQWAVEQDLDYLFHVEEDFIFTGAVDILELRDILDLNPELAQVCLQRQATAPHEIYAGGVMKALGAEARICNSCGLRWSVQSSIFSLNPSLIPRHVFELGWPTSNESGFTQQLLDLGYAFGFLGHPSDMRVVDTIGNMRSAGWRE